MMRGRTLLLRPAVLCRRPCCAAGAAQQPPGGWQTRDAESGRVLPGMQQGAQQGGQQGRSKARRARRHACADAAGSAAQHHGGAAHARRNRRPAARPGVAAGHLTEDSQSIQQGLVWRVFRDIAGPDGKARLVSTHREASPTLRLEAGDYFVNVALGRAQPDAQDHGDGRAGRAGALRAQRRRPAPGCGARQRRGGQREGRQLRRASPTSATSTGSASRSMSGAKARRGRAPQCRHLQHRQHLRRRQRGCAHRRHGGGGQAVGGDAHPSRRRSVTLQAGHAQRRRRHRRYAMEHRHGPGRGGQGERRARCRPTSWRPAPMWSARGTRARSISASSASRPATSGRSKW